MSYDVNSPKNKRMAVIGAVVMVLAVFVILSGGGNVITKPFVEAQLQAFSQKIAHEAGKAGGQASFTYDDVTIEGFMFTKRAVISNPELSYTVSGPFRQKTTSIRTATAIAEPDKITGSYLTVAFPAAFHVSENGKEVVIASFQGGQPLYAQSRGAGEKGTAMIHSLDLPPGFTLASVAEQGEKPESPFVVSYDAKPLAQYLQYGDGSGESRVSMRNIRIREQEAAGEKITISSLSSTKKLGAEQEGKAAFDTVLSVTDIGIRTQQGEAGPYSLKFSAEGQAHAAASAAEMDIDMKVRELTIQADKYALKAGGDVRQKPGDPLPSGALNVTITNFPELRDSELIPESFRPALMNVAQAITGQSVAGMQDVTFALKRAQGGTLQIGQVTFEQLMAYILPQVMQFGAPPPVTPLEVPPEAFTPDMPETIPAIPQPGQ